MNRHAGDSILVISSWARFMAGAATVGGPTRREGQSRRKGASALRTASMNAPVSADGAGCAAYTMARS